MNSTPSCEDGTGWWMKDIPLYEQIPPLAAQLASVFIGMPIHLYIALNLIKRIRLFGMRKYQICIIAQSIVDIFLSFDHVFFEMNRTRRLFFSEYTRRAIVFMWQALSILAYLFVILTAIFWKTATVSKKSADDLMAGLLTIIAFILVTYCFANEVLVELMPWRRTVGLLMTESCQLGSLVFFCSVFAFYYVKIRKVDTRLCTAHTRRVQTKISSVLLFETVYYVLILVPNIFRYLVHYWLTGCYTPDRSDHIAWWISFQIYWTCSGMAPLVRACLNGLAFKSLLVFNLPQAERSSLRTCATI